MPPNDRPDIVDLAKRVKALEEKKVAVKDLPMNSIRKALAAQPQASSDLLLPHSVGSAQLNVDMASQVFGTVNPIPEGAYNHSAYTIPENGKYLILGVADTEVLEVSFLVAQIRVNGGAYVTGLNSTALQRMPISLNWCGSLNAGSVVTWTTERTTGKCALYSGIINIIRLG